MNRPLFQYSILQAGPHNFQELFQLLGVSQATSTKHVYMYLTMEKHQETFVPCHKFENPLSDD